jgi:hypothetical protein
MSRLVIFLTERLGVFGSWWSFARVAAWIAVWVLVISFVVDPGAPSIDSRDVDADSPASTVRYPAPTSRQDFAGFIAPEQIPDTFQVAWIGGSEVKLREVSVPGTFDQVVTTFGGERVQIDAYSMIAPRPIDIVRAMDTAVANGADAMVIALNPAWVSDEWSMRDWPNLDVSNLGSLWRRPSAWPWAASLTTPADVAWRLTRAASPIVEAQLQANDDVRELVDRIDLVARPAEPDPSAAPEPDADDADARLPGDSTSFWLVQEHGPEVVDDVMTRLDAMIAGFDDSTPTADYFAEMILQTAHDAEIPVFMYTTPFSYEALADDDFGGAVIAVENYWRDLSDDIESLLVEIDWRSSSRDWATPGIYFDVVHMADPGPFVQYLRPLLCNQWAAAHPDKECA